jgi:hypothetical protein
MWREHIRSVARPGAGLIESNSHLHPDLVAGRRHGDTQTGYCLGGLRGAEGSRPVALGGWGLSPGGGQPLMTGYELGSPTCVPQAAGGGVDCRLEGGAGVGPALPLAPQAVGLYPATKGTKVRRSQPLWLTMKCAVTIILESTTMLMDSLSPAMSPSHPANS